jgi:hypothetical protein
MSFKVNIDSVTLDVVSARLKGVVSPYHILQWLANFKENEVGLAIGLLKNLTVFTSGEIEEVYHQGLYDILRAVPQDEKVAVLPIGAYGKSGTMMTYLLKKTDAYKSNARRITLCPTSEALKELRGDHSCLVLLDDFVGTGKSVGDYFKSDIEPYAKQFKQIRFLGVAGMQVGKRNITQLFTQLHIPEEHIYTRAFSADASYFGYRNHIAYRELAFDYGCKLTKLVGLKSGGHKYVNALGFGNSQALVSFFYGSPNNTLPIFWQGDFGKTKWFPLIPRFSNHKIALARAFRKKLSFELSLFKEFGSENLIESFATLSIKRGSKRFTSVSSIDFSLYGILKLQREGVHELNICQRLGISLDDYMEYLDEGKKRGLFDSRHNLTTHGLELYEEAHACIKNSQKVTYEDRETYDLRNINYLPRKFNGRS